jgi:hypothetical protein
LGEGGLKMASALPGQYDLKKYFKSFAAPVFFIHTVSQNKKLTIKYVSHEK